MFKAQLKESVSSPFDCNYIQKNYIDLGCADVLAEVFQIFQESAPQKLAALQVACAGKNFIELRQLAHSLKGESGSIGGKYVRHVAENIEKAARVEDLQQIAALLPELELELDRLLLAIKEELAG